MRIFPGSFRSWSRATKARQRVSRWWAPCVISVMAAAGAARAGDITGTRIGQFGEGIHESFLWFTGAGNNTLNQWAIGYSLGGSYTVNNVSPGIYYAMANEKEEYPASFRELNVPVPAGGAITVNFLDRNTMATQGVTDLGPAIWAGQTFIATGRELAYIGVLTPSSLSSVRATIHEDEPGGPTIGPARDIPTNALHYGFGYWNAGEVPLIPGKRYAVRLSVVNAASWRPGVSFQYNPFPNGHCWIDGVEIPEADLRIAVVCRDSGFMDEYRVSNWWRAKTFSELVQTFRARGEELRAAQLLLAGSGSPARIMRASVHPWNGAFPLAAPIGSVKYSEMAPDQLRAFVWGPGEVPLAPDQQYAIRFVRTDGGTFSIYGNEDNYDQGQAYFDGLPDNGIDMSGRFYTKERNRGDIVVTNLTFTPISATEVQATFETDVPTRATVAWRRGNPVFDTIVPDDGHFGTSHTVVARHMAGAATHQMYILAYNAARNVYKGTPATVQTLNQTASLAGRVTSQVGAAAGAEILIVELNARTTTNATGHFSFAGLHTGRHTLRVQGVALEPIEREISILPGQSNTLNLQTRAYSNALAGTDSNPFNGWTKYGQFDGQFNNGDAGVYARTGTKWVGSSGSWSPRTGGAYRQMTTVPGRNYRYGGYIWTRCSGLPITCPGLAVARIGVDPTGGVSPAAPTVIWKRYWFTDATWEEQTIDFSAQGSQATLFISHKWEVYYELPASWIAGFDDLWLGSPLPPIPDFDRDGDVDHSDFGHLQGCLSGAGRAQEAPECADALLDADTDVDLDDFAIFQGCFSGAGQPFNPGCVSSEQQ